MNYTVYNAEYTTHIHSGAVGLAYLSDYYFAYDENGNTNCNSKICNSWMIPNETDRSSLWSSKEYEWPMTRYDYDSYRGIFHTWHVYKDGSVDWSGPNSTYAVRPVFYLKSNVTISGGSGTLSAPYIIN